MAGELVGNAALDLQRRAWDRTVANSTRCKAALAPAAAPSSSTTLAIGKTEVFLGCRVMWDEAGQRLRSLATKFGDSGAPMRSLLSGGAQAVVEVLAMVCVLFVMVLHTTPDGYRACQRWEPWLAPMRPLAATTANHILEGLLTNVRITQTKQYMLSFT
jgi:hypothetical protein